MSKMEAGGEVPTPMRPLLCCMEKTLPPTVKPPAKVEVEVLVTERFVMVEVPAMSEVMVVVAIVTEPSLPTANMVVPDDEATCRIFPVCPPTPLIVRVGCVVEPDKFDMYVA